MTFKQYHRFSGKRVAITYASCMMMLLSQFPLLDSQGRPGAWDPERGFHRGEGSVSGCGKALWGRQGVNHKLMISVTTHGHLQLLKQSTQLLNFAKTPTVLKNILDYLPQQRTLSCLKIQIPKGCDG